MTETPMALEVCLCGNCETAGHAKEVLRPLTAGEITQRDLDAATYAAQVTAEEAVKVAKAAARTSALAKLEALGLTPDEAIAIVGAG
jgi:hypothetical protein